MHAAMLRAALQTSRARCHGSIAATAGRQWQSAQAGAVFGAKRAFADVQKPSIGDSKPIVLPGSASSSTTVPPPPGRVGTIPSSTTPTTPTANPSIPPQNVPLVPPAPYPSTIQTAPPTAVTSSPRLPGSSIPSPPSLPEPPARKPTRRLRNFLITMMILSIAGFGGGVYYSRVNDNFHDFFTEYVPFGEEAVLYFEEKEFRKRFPAMKTRQPRDTGGSTTIPSQSGLSWKVTDATKPADEKHGNAVKENSSKTNEALQSPSEVRPQEQVKAVEAVKNEARPPTPRPSGESKPVVELAPKRAVETPKQPVTTSTKLAASKMPEVDEPSRFPPEVAPIDPINIKDANEPLVQDLVKMINDIILVVNADNANAKFSSTITKAKSELTKVGGKILALKKAAEQEADEKVKASHVEFDRAAKELIRRIEGEMHEQETQWKDEYEKERQKLQENFEQKLKVEIDRAKEINDKVRQNELLEQAVEMKRKFVAEVKDRVEEERDSRLGKLTDLSKTVGELEKLTTDWNSVLDANLKTQHLHVAVEAVRSSLESSATPKPFVRELAALKEIAADDPVVNAAIASINPVAYQRGIPSSAQLIDRFRRVAGEVRKASLLPEEAGVASHASSYLLSKILFKKKGLAAGNDVESILTRTETFLEEGNLDEATREMNGLTGWAKTLSKDWLSEARKVLEVQQALDVITTEARLQSLRVD